MSPSVRIIPLAGLLLAAAPFVRPGSASAFAQAPTLPSDTLEANYAPPSEVAPMPGLAPSLPSDTLEVDESVDRPDAETTDTLKPGPARDDAIEDRSSSSPY